MSDSPQSPTSFDDTDVESRILELMELPHDVRGEAIDALCLEHPEREAVIRAWIERVHALWPTRREGERVGPFRLLEVLGRGGMGVVYLAEREGYAQRVALKLLQVEGLVSSVMLQLFHREATLAARVIHPNVCRVLEPGVAEGIPYIAMEYIEGDTLASHLRSIDAGEEARPSCDMVTRWLAQAARGVQAAHDVGLIHRDITPRNIMIRQTDSIAMVVDFGLARAVEDPVSTSFARLAGTLPYSAPEQVRGEPADARTDVYGLGATLYHALTGVRPFRGTSDHRTMRAILDETPIDPRRIRRDVPRDLAVITMAALEKRSTHRIATAEQFAEELERTLDGRPILTRRAHILERSWRWCVRHPTATALVAVLILATASLAWLWWTTLVMAEENAIWAAGGLVRSVLDREQQLPPPRPEALASYDRILVDDAARIAEVRRILDRELPRLRPLATDIGSLQRLAAFERFLADIVTFENDVVPRLRAERTWASRVEEVTITRYREVWQRVAREVANDPVYGGQLPDFPPQIGLVPLGRNPVTGLQEFYHLRSAWDPRSTMDPGDVPLPARDPDTGEFAIGEETGIVFVLIPPGTIDARNEHRSNMPIETMPVRPFLLARHELTQGQWMRMSSDRRNPSSFKAPGVAFPVKSSEEVIRETVDSRHAVESVSASTTIGLLKRFSLRLPSSIEWRYAAMAGEREPYRGATRETMQGFENLPDLQWARATKNPNPWPIDDGWVGHWPVGSGNANPFGLHDVHGNVREWTRSRRVGTERGIHMGGSFRKTSEAGNLRWGDDALDYRDNDLGCRVARDVECSVRFRPLNMTGGAPLAGWEFGLLTTERGRFECDGDSDGATLRLHPDPVGDPGSLTVLFVDPRLTWDPRTRGPLGRIRLRIDVSRDDVDLVSLPAYPILEQNGRIFIGPMAQLAEGERRNSLEFNVRPERHLRSFRDLAPLGPRADRPLDAGGDPLRVGFAVWLTTAGSGYERSLTIHAVELVPER